jgi:hypothetical protein
LGGGQGQGETLWRWVAGGYDSVVLIPNVLPQRVANDGILAMRAAIAEHERWAVEPKVDGVRGLVVAWRTGDPQPPRHPARLAAGASAGLVGGVADFDPPAALLG